MKYVIEIPDNFNLENEINTVSNSVIRKALRNGTPLPKGHKRLIEDNFEIGPVYDMEGNLSGYLYVTQEDLNNAPTIIEADKTESEDNNADSD